LALKATHEVSSPASVLAVSCKCWHSAWLASLQKPGTSSFPKKPLEEPTGIYEDMFAAMITAFVYSLLAKLSISCQYLKSSHSGNPTFTKRT